jgi:hypothetical protein
VRQPRGGRSTRCWPRMRISERSAAESSMASSPARSEHGLPSIGDRILWYLAPPRFGKLA